VRHSQETAFSPGPAVTVFPGNARPSLAARRHHTIEAVDNRAEIRDFLTSRRARITPERAGLPLYGTNRRVAGLRREEVGMLAGVSTDYYTRLERGNLIGVSESVLEALAGALQLDEAERTHLFDLARAANAGGRQRQTAPKQHVREGVQRILESIGAPAYVRNNFLDVLGVNRLGRALLADLYTDGASRPNLARYMFVDARSRDFYVEWAAVAKDVVAALRIEAGRNPYDRGLTDLVGELSIRSEEFRTWWASHDVRLHRASAKKMNHPVAGTLQLTGEALELPGDSGLTIITYTVDPASQSAEALQFLANWASEETPSSPSGSSEPPLSGPEEKWMPGVRPRDP
jgi:transcriptional regulator with XRE-family HTH domain